MRLLLTFQPVITRNNCSSDSPVIVRIGRPCKPTPLSGSMPAKGCIYIDIVFTQPEQSAVIPFVSGKVRPVVLCVNLPYHSFIRSITELDSSGKHPVRLLEIPPARINLVIQTQVLIIQVNRQGSSCQKSLCPLHQHRQRKRSLRLYRPCCNLLFPMARLPKALLHILVKRLPKQGLPH